MRIVYVLAVCAVLVQACAKKPDYVATPFFSEEQFARVRPGMTGDQVRDLLGCPWDRFGPIEQDGGRVDWRYAFAADVTTGPVQYQQFEVQFESNGTVRKTHSARVGMDWSEGLADNLLAAQNLKRPVDDFHLIRADGTTEVLKTDDPRVHLILLSTDRPNGSIRMSSAPDWLAEEREALSRSGAVVAVEHFYIGENAAEFAKQVKQLGEEEEARNSFVNAKPVVRLTGRDLDVGMLLYKSGALYSMAPLFLDNHDDWLADQKWLVRKLARER